MRYKVRNAKLQEELLLTTELRINSTKRGRWYANSSDRGLYNRRIRFCGKVNLFCVGLFSGSSIKESPLYKFYEEESKTPIIDSIKNFMWSIPKP